MLILHRTWSSLFSRCRPSRQLSLCGQLQPRPSRPPPRRHCRRTSSFPRSRSRQLMRPRSLRPGQLSNRSHPLVSPLQTNSRPLALAHLRLAKLKQSQRKLLLNPTRLPPSPARALPNQPRSSSKKLLNRQLPRQNKAPASQPRPVKQLSSRFLPASRNKATRQKKAAPKPPPSSHS